jgi:uncharacterized membrane protein YbhN (UPF0104 family)
LRLAVGTGVLAVLLTRLGPGPFLDGIGLVSLRSLVAALAITAATTVCCAWRWRLVAGRLGADVPLRSAVAAYYRSQFLNATLPGGVLGDVHRAFRQGCASGDVAGSVRSVAWERSLGQMVGLTLAVVCVVLLPSPVRPPVGVTLMAAVAAGLFAVAVAVAVRPARMRTRAPTPARRAAAGWRRAPRRVADDLREIGGSRRSGLGMVAASTAATGGHVTLFVVAARTVGLADSTWQLVPLALLVLAVSALPINIGGWGPREGAAAWVFGVGGHSAAQGLTVAVVYGAMALVATLPGAVMLVLASRRSIRPNGAASAPV